VVEREDELEAERNVVGLAEAEKETEAEEREIEGEAGAKE